MYIILVKCNDHFHYLVCDFTAKGQHKSKQEVHVYLYSEFFPLQMYLTIVHSELLVACLLPLILKLLLVAFKSKQIKSACTSFACADL